jgi:hypothetical protein
VIPTSTNIPVVTHPKGTGEEEEERRRRKPIPELPAWKAFVVQFSREACTQAGVFSGRVEHLSSGRRARFSSKEELLAILAKLLDEIGAAPETEGSGE